MIAPIPAGNYRYHVWRAGAWWRAVVRAVDGRVVLDLHLLDACAVDGRASATDDAFSAVQRDCAMRAGNTVRARVGALA